MGFVGGDHVVVGLVLLKHEPHRLNVVAGEPPIPLGVEVAEIEFLLESELDSRGGPCDLPRHEGLTAARALVVEKNPTGAVNAVALPVVDGDPVGVELGHAIRATGIEGRGLRLRRFHHLAVHLRAGGLVEADLGADSVLTVADRLQQPEGAHGGHVGRVGGLVETDPHVALGREVVDLRRPDLADQTGEPVAVGHVAVMQNERTLHLVDVAVEVLDPLRAKRAGPAHQAVNLVSFVEEQFGEVRTILPGDTRDQGPLQGSRHVILTPG